MQKTVIYRDMQEFQANDPNNQQAFAKQTFTDLIADAITPLAGYVGFGVIGKSATEVTVSTGRLYDGGAVWITEAEADKTLFSLLPLVQKRIVAVTVWGHEVEEDIEPRDFLTDLTSGTTEPQAVPMTRVNRAVIDLVSGAESIDPQKPDVPSTALAVAWITLTTAGIEDIETDEENQLPNARDIDGRLKQVEGWRDQAEPRIGSIASDLAGLAKQVSGTASHAILSQIAGDIAAIKERFNIPDAAANWDADYYYDDAKSDDAQAGYSALVDYGLRFGHAGAAVMPLALLNPVEPQVHRSANDLVLPAYTPEIRLTAIGYSGTVALNAYPAYNWNWTRADLSAWRQHHGRDWNRHAAWWNSTAQRERDRHAEGDWRVNRHAWYWRQLQPNAYVPGQSLSNQSGSLCAQTVLISNAMWLTKVAIPFTAVDASGDVTLLITATAAGKPDLSQVITEVTVPAADLDIYYNTPHVGGTVFVIEPTLLEGGKRYALVFITQGAHRVAVVSGSRYTAGTLFYGTDGDYLAGDLTKDLMFTLFAARFDVARAEVPLGSIALAGGMTDIDIKSKQVVPEGTELTFEVQINGQWRPLDNESDILQGLQPDLVPLRAVFTGTLDMMPALRLNVDGVTATRPAESLTHWSAERTLDAASENIDVQLVVDVYDDANHSLTVELVSGATTYGATGPATAKGEEGATRLTYSFAPDPGTGISAYRIKITATRTAGAPPFAITERTDIAL